jgi:hypothetical protein
MINICDVYKSEDKPEVYIYVSRQEGLSRVPSELLKSFGEPKLTLSFNLTPEKKLVKEDSREVARNLEEQGYHLQMPPIIIGELGKRED